MQQPTPQPTTQNTILAYAALALSALVIVLIALAWFLHDINQTDALDAFYIILGFNGLYTATKWQAAPDLLANIQAFVAQLMTHIQALHAQQISTPLAAQLMQTSTPTSAVNTTPTPILPPEPVDPGADTIPRLQAVEAPKSTGS